MDYYYIALRVADVAFVGIWLATFYYFSRSVFTYILKHPNLAGLRNILQSVVQNARIIHPYIGLAVLLLFPYHAFTMATTYGVNAKTALGSASSLTFLVTAVLGLTLWRNRGNLSARTVHRRLMFLLLTVVTWHVALRL